MLTKEQKNRQLVLTIRKILKEKKIKKFEFAAMMDANPSLVSRWLNLNKLHNFRISTLIEMEMVLNAEILSTFKNN